MSSPEYNTDFLDAYCANVPETEAQRTVSCMIYDGMGGLSEGLNVFFLLFAATMVFFMQAGFAMLCAGSVRQKNVKNIMLKNLLDACGAAIGFWSVGYAFAYDNNSSGNTSFIGTANFFVLDFGTGSEIIGWFFQFAFAATAATIVAGTVAERCKMQAYLCYSLFLTAFVYPVVVRSIWSSNGFLTAFRDDPIFDVGVIDFAGSGVVHLTGGATALIAAIILGPRKGRFYDENGKPLETPAEFKPHSVALQMLGTFILWVGWYGFNPGSALIIDNRNSALTAAVCAATTTVSAAVGCVTCMFTDTIIVYMATGEASYDLTCAMNGALAGLVAITAGCAVVTPFGALPIGIVAGWVYLGFSKFLIKMKIDDAVDAIPVHFANGIWGVIAVGLFAETDLMGAAGYNNDHTGWFYSWGKGSSDATLLVVQLISVLWICGWVAATMTPFFLALNALGMFRVDAEEEEIGLDISHHRGAAYDLSGPSKENMESFTEIRAARQGEVELPKEVKDKEETAEKIFDC